MHAAPASGIVVIKIGGGLSRIPDALDRACAAVTQAAGAYRIVVVPGGGPFADAVREFQRLIGITDETAHWMAILAMDQYAHVLAGRIPNAELVEEPGAIARAVIRGKVAVLAPSRWMRSADVLPHNWAVTSDSVAAFVAGALDAVNLILVKPIGQGDLVDGYFATARPSDLPFSVMGYEEFEEWARRFSG